MATGEGNGIPLQCSCLENPMDGGAWWAANHGVAKSWTQLSDFTFTFHFSLSCIGEGNGNPLQYSCLENPRDLGAWWAAVYGVAQSPTRLKRLNSSRSGDIKRESDFRYTGFSNFFKNPWDLRCHFCFCFGRLPPACRFLVPGPGLEPQSRAARVPGPNH